MYPASFPPTELEGWREGRGEDWRKRGGKRIVRVAVYWHSRGCFILYPAAAPAQKWTRLGDATNYD